MYFFSVLRKGKYYLPDHCTFQFKLGIPCTPTSGPKLHMHLIIYVLPLCITIK